METHAGDPTARGLKDIVRDLQQQFVLLMKDEVALARSEFKDKTETYKKNSVSALTGGIVAYTGILLIAAGLGFLLYRVFVALGMTSLTAMWVAPLVLGIVVAIIGGVMLRQALNAMKDESLMPERTIHSLKEDRQWAQKKVA